MTAHDHSEFVEGCFRCELSRREAADEGLLTFECCDCGHDWAGDASENVCPECGSANVGSDGG